ncbi:MAG: DUF4124 domain-containing protein [Gammaproteobacteria bacterium]|nr:DUF4124 domain-containing protein [Gammaproteobacteria bacterium]
MLTNRIIFVLLLLCAGAVSAQVYKWVDEDGVVHYSDQPHPGAERVDIKQNTFRAPSAGTQPARGDAAEQSQPDRPFAYESLTFSSPTAEQTLWNIGGTLNVTLSLSPGLRNGDRVTLYVDGASQPIAGLSTQLEEVWRGAHNLQAEVVDANGTLMIRSDPIRFYVQQTSVQN